MDDTKKIALTTPLVLFIILIEGFITIAVEMLTIRQLITVVGNSVVITSLIIGIFLLFLALGYYRGGRYTKHYFQVLRNNFTWAALLLGIGLSYAFIQYSFDAIFHLSKNGLIATTIYLFIITAPLVYLLGQTVPITTNLFQHEHIGRISGKVLYLSTLGSFLGSVLTTLVLMNFLGVAWSVFINFALIIVVIILLSNYPEGLLRLILLSLVGAIVFVFNIGIEQKLFVRTNNYGDYQIVSGMYLSPGKVGTLLNINNSPSSFLSIDHQGFEYIELIKKILFQDLKCRDKNILVLGAGGFSLSAESNYTNRFTYVDIDGDLPNIVKRGFIDTINGNFISTDARQFLNHTTVKFAAVVSDVYSGHHAIPFHLLTKQYFQSVQAVLEPNGVAIFNIIANPFLKDHYSKRVDNTIRSVFSNCMSVPMPYHDGPANIIYVCSARNNSDHTTYTDNKNAAMIDIYSSGL
jgi:spermidine synthase